jgi:TonB family protein
LKKEKKEDTFIKPPFYKGGIKAMNELIYGNLKYPKEAIEKKAEGVVIIKYDINHLGNVIDAKVIKSIGHGCDEEALRVVKLLHFEVPKNPRKLKITFHKDIHIHFKFTQTIEGEKSQINAPQHSPELNFTYTILPSKSNSPSDETSKVENSVYTYSIKLH